MSLRSNASSLNDLSLDNFMTLAHSVSIEGLDTNFRLRGNDESEETHNQDDEKEKKKKNEKKETDDLREAIEVLKKSLLDFEIELVFSNDIELDELNLKIQKYYYNKMLYESLERDYREKKNKSKSTLALNPSSASTHIYHREWGVE
jgi:HSP90 family molecular chaperone